ncbi:MAG TPA: FAD/NAD(P)-binding protein [Chitinophagales bacterium]|nr:FAD/NAD(P)-binding protein [Chitinophagales bacterium]
MYDKKTAVIVGGGAAGIITAIHLLRQGNDDINLVIVDKSKGNLCRGIAFAGNLPFAPLNVAAGKMGLSSIKPDDFYCWLQSKPGYLENGNYNAGSYVPRKWFGDYLEDALQREQARCGNRCRVLNDEVDDIDLGPGVNQYSLKLKSGTQLAAQYIVIATGNELPMHIFDNTTIEKLGGRYIGNPWHCNISSLAEQQGDVLIIGTGLSMVDIAGSLNYCGHRAKITAFSRRGLLPQIHTQPNEITLSWPSQASLHEVFNLLRGNIAQAQLNSYAWQDVIDSLRAHTPGLWQGFSVQEKQTFLRYLRVYWDIHRHRMPAESAKMLQELEAAGKFVVVSGRAKGVEVMDDRIVFNYTGRGGKPASVTAGVIINCVGPNSDYSKSGNLLMVNLMAKGMAVQDELKLGIKTGRHGELLQGNNEPLTNVYAIGGLRKPAEWETVAIPEIRAQAEAISALISSGGL